MASRASNRWLWRDIRLVYVLLVWAAFACSLFAYFNGGITLHRNADAGAPKGESDQEIYTGSILLVPTYGNRCTQMLLDNRTGRMWDYGDFDCDKLSQRLVASEPRGITSEVRVKAISSAFRGAEK